MFSRPAAHESSHGQSGEGNGRQGASGAGGETGEGGGKPEVAAAPAKAEKALKVAPAKRLDHGELSIPGRTNNINAELDRYKKQQAAQSKKDNKQQAAKKRESKAKAKDLFAKYGSELIDKHKEKLGEKELKHHLDQLVKWEPDKFIKLVDRHLSEKSAGNASEEPKKSPKATTAKTAPKAAKPKTPKQPKAPKPKKADLLSQLKGLGQSPSARTTVAKLKEMLADLGKPDAAR